ncbi:unnamed protein product [Callosobruchus maculatus]|uniref:Uncharacterized protein n=1 Tax=Callosobruchus maculatus TaxID=64391 RepID=A0A653DHQ7_CALMS|nr:unnamed protein product [Callosobruchus maculatus]
MAVKLLMMALQWKYLQTTNVYYSRQINSLACSREVKLHNHICFIFFPVFFSGTEK